jgi:beta-glucosidase-like glycosyl hydrolase
VECREILTSIQHFAAHGSPQAGHNTAPFMGYGVRQVVQEMLVPFKAAVDLGGVKGVMMYVPCQPIDKLNILTESRAYSEFDDVPCSLNPILYKALDDWGFDGSLYPT